MEQCFSRTAHILGNNAMEILANSRIAVFGVGGVGGYVVEALARCGVGEFDLIDNDTVSETNLNRQLIATRDTIGKYKTEVMRDRILSINPNCKVNIHTCFYLPDTKDEFDFSQYTYVIDAIDTVTAKISIIMECQAAGVPIISSMGTGNKLDPTRLEITDIYKTSVCPLAKVMRHELKKRNVKHVKVLFSKEEPLRPIVSIKEANCNKRDIPGSCSFVPSAGGLIIASEVVKDLTRDVMVQERSNS